MSEEINPIFYDTELMRRQFSVVKYGVYFTSDEINPVFYDTELKPHTNTNIGLEFRESQREPEREPERARGSQNLRRVSLSFFSLAKPSLRSLA